jgi:hypothetical protein
MNRSATTRSTRRDALSSAPSRAGAAVLARIASNRRSLPEVLALLLAGGLRLVIGSAFVAAVVLLGPGLLLDTPQPPPTRSDAIVVISGDEQMARFSEGVNLYERGLGRYLVFSGAAFDNGTSNADVMRDLAVQRGVPDSAILEEPFGEDTWGNAVHTRQVLEEHGLRSAILVTSPYPHCAPSSPSTPRAERIDLMDHAAPDSEWRKRAGGNTPTRRLTFTELQKLGISWSPGQYHERPPPVRAHLALVRGPASSSSSRLYCAPGACPS